MTLIFGLGLALAVTTAVRSTWSPCGVSMLSVITPIQEQTRGNRFSTTAGWFLFGSTIGGAMLGGLIGVLGLVLASVGLSSPQALILISVGSVVAVVSDGQLFGFQLPGHDRQVNERWLDQFRSWVYGAGFGWQIGFGLATYIMTAGLYLLILVGALGTSMVEGVILGSVFGAIRGLAVFASSGITHQGALNDFHRSFERWRQPVRKLTMVVIALAGAVAGLGSGDRLGLVTAATAAVALALSLQGDRETTYRLASSS